MAYIYEGKNNDGTYNIAQATPAIPAHYETTTSPTGNVTTVWVPFQNAVSTGSVIMTWAQIVSLGIQSIVPAIDQGGFTGTSMTISFDISNNGTIINRGVVVSQSDYNLVSAEIANYNPVLINLNTNSGLTINSNYAGLSALYKLYPKVSTNNSIAVTVRSPIDLATQTFYVSVFDNTIYPPADIVSSTPVILCP